MASYVTYEKDTNDQERSKVGGSSLLPQSIGWPVDRFGKKLMFLASLSSDLLKSECGIDIPQGHILSIFCPYEKEDIEYPIDMARGRERGFVVVHPAEAPRQEFGDPILPAKKLELNKKFATDEDEFVEDIDDKIGGRPNWLQDRFDYAGNQFVMQISGMYFGKIIPTHKNVFMSGVLYVFYNLFSNEGLVTLQYS